jgi:hypothetical protein
MARGYKEWVVNLIIGDHAATAAQLPSCHIYTLHNYEMRDIRLNIAGCSVLVSIPGKVDLFLIHPQSGPNQYFRTFVTAFSPSVGIKQQVSITAKSHSRTISRCPASGLSSEN